MYDVYGTKDGLIVLLHKLAMSYSPIMQVIIFQSVVSLLVQSDCQRIAHNTTNPLLCLCGHTHVWYVWYIADKTNL